MFKKLRNRLLILNMTIISIVMIAAFSVIYVITYINIQKENESKLEKIPSLARVDSINRDFQTLKPNQKHPRITFLRIPLEHSLAFTMLVDRQGQVIDVWSYIDMPNETYQEIAKNTWSTNRANGSIDVENRTWQYQMSSYEKKKIIRLNGGLGFIQGEGLYLISFLDVTDSSETLTRLLVTFLVVGVGMLFILFGVSFYFANRSIRPIEDNWEKQKQFVADASHELKTPLAIIQANTDALLINGDETVNSQKKWINYIQTESSRTGKLVNDLLYLAKVEDTQENQSSLNLSDIVLDVVASMEAIVYEKGIQLTQTIEPNLMGKGDAEKIKQAVLILLDNATKYSDENGEVEIVLKKCKNQAVFSVQNSGEPIPFDKLPRIFDRFYRSDPSRSQKTGGYGLGLAIAKTIINRSGGHIYAESNEKRTTFTFELKLH